MTHAKSPIEQAVAALEKFASLADGYNNDNPHTRVIGFADAHVTIGDLYAAKEALAAIRASTGKMKAAEAIYYAGKPQPDDNGVTEYVTIGTFEADNHYEDSIAHVVGGNHDPVQNAKMIVDALNAVAAQPEPRPLPECEWVDDPDGYWKTSCGHAFYLSDGTPADNNIEWCCYCGGSMIPKPTGAPK